MRKLVVILFLITMAIASFGEPYRPYPIIYIHGYAADHYNSGNFGTIINSSHIPSDIINPTTTSPVPEKIGEYTNNYISRNECKRLEEGKLAYQVFEYNKDILNYWNNLYSNDQSNIYWIKNDEDPFHRIPSYDQVMDTLNNIYCINAFTETMEFDYPASGSSDSTMSHPDFHSGEEDDKYPDVYQIGRKMGTVV